MSSHRVAILGASGAVGRELLNVLASRSFPMESLRLGGHRTAGQSLTFAGESLKVKSVDESFFRGVDVVFEAVATDVARRFAPMAVQAGATVVDKSNAFRMDPEVPLVVPEVNPDAIATHKGIIASPNCSTIQLVVALNPIRKALGLKRVFVSTYQAVSGTGLAAMDELTQGTRAALEGASFKPEVYPQPIAFNVLAKCDDFDEDGFTREELKLERESRKIWSDEPEVPLSATAVRVPVYRGHAEAVMVETAKDASLADVKACLSGAPGVRLFEDGEIPTPRDADGQDDVFVGRVRADRFTANTFHLFVVADNLRKGAATNAVQIAERLAGSP